MRIRQNKKKRNSTIEFPFLNGTLIPFILTALGTILIGVFKERIPIGTLLIGIAT
jgi:hypothetical protein